MTDAEMDGWMTHLLVLVLQLGLGAFGTTPDRLGVVPHERSRWIRVEAAILEKGQTWQSVSTVYVVS